MSRGRGALPLALPPALALALPPALALALPPALALALALAAPPARGATPVPLCPLYNPNSPAPPAPPRPHLADSVASSSPPLRVHYCHPSLRPMAERVLHAAVHSYQVEVGELGFAAPLPDHGRGGGEELDIYLANLGRGGRAQANDEPLDKKDPRSCGYVVIDYRTPEDNDYLSSYVSHEMHHVLQYAMGRLLADAFMEATAAWIDDHIYPHADALPAMVADFQREPHRPIYHHGDKTSYDYGAALFISYLVQRHGLPLLQRVFARGEPDYLASLDAELHDRGGLRGALRDFAAWRVRTGRYHRPDFFPGGQRFAEVALDRAVSPFEFIDRPLDVRPAHPPQELGTVYLGMDLTTPIGGGLAIEVRADRGPGALAVDLIGSDAPAPLAGALLRGGERATLLAHGLRPGMRLWLAVTNLGDRPPRLRIGPNVPPAHGFSTRFSRLPEP